jgi:phosphoserine phosphatase RsbU/P
VQTSPVGARDAELGIDSAALLNALVDAVVVASDTGTIIYVNPSAERLLGEPSTVLVGLPLVAIIPERLRAQHTEASDAMCGLGLRD